MVNRTKTLAVIAVAMSLMLPQVALAQGAPEAPPPTAEAKTEAQAR